MFLFLNLPVKQGMEMFCFLGPRSARRVPQPHREILSEPVFEPEGEAEYSWKSGGLPCRRTGAPRIGAPRVHAPGELASARWGEERRGPLRFVKRRALRGVVSFGDFSLDKQRKVTQGAGAEPPAIMLLNRARSAHNTDSVGQPPTSMFFRIARKARDTI
jgi:hypothetical protein